MAAPNPSATMAAAAAATPARAWWRTDPLVTASTAAVSCFRVGAKNLTGLQMTSIHMNKVRTVHVKSREAEGSPSTESTTHDEEILQRDLQTAIQEEDYAQAVKFRDELRVLQEDSRSTMLAANARFDNAFKNGNLVTMHLAWAKGDHVYVVHPLAGWI